MAYIHGRACAWHVWDIAIYPIAAGALRNVAQRKCHYVLTEVSVYRNVSHAKHLAVHANER